MRSAELREELERVFPGSEPPVGDGVAHAFRQAGDHRVRTLVAATAGAAALLVAVVVVLGYALASALVPAHAGPGSAQPAAAWPRADPVLPILQSAADEDLSIVAREPAGGAGWRLYTVLDRATGQARGLIEVSVYAAPYGLCFPAPGDPAVCTRPKALGAGVEYARYGGRRDVDWQVYQAMARRLSDGRVMSVMATGERGTGDAGAGRPPLTPLQTVRLAGDSSLMSAFADGETCNGADPACPLLLVPVPVAG
jgi:hypothetical protein